MTRRDPVSPAVARAVLLRDRMCFLARLDDTHICRGRWGDPHAATDLDQLTLEHVKTELRMGVRAANVGVPSKVQRQAMRAYLAEVAA
jgi:hypothetical protein